MISNNKIKVQEDPQNYQIRSNCPEEKRNAVGNSQSMEGTPVVCFRAIHKQVIIWLILRSWETTRCESSSSDPVNEKGIPRWYCLFRLSSEHEGIRNFKKTERDRSTSDPHTESDGEREGVSPRPLSVGIIIITKCFVFSSLLLPSTVGR